MSKKHAEVKPSLNEWVAHIHGSSKPLAVAASRLLRDQYGGYTFTGPDGIIADFPPGQVSYVTRKPRVTVTMTGHGATGAIFAGGGGSGSGGGGATSTGGNAAVTPAVSGPGGGGASGAAG